MDMRRAWWGAGSVMLLVLTAAGTAGAQDSNYWSIAYGTRSQLLGGVVIGSPGDISSVFYNPGALALAGPTELLLTASAFQYQKISVDNGSGPGRTLGTSTVGTVPSLFAGEIPMTRENRIAYVFLNRRSMDMELQKRTTEGVESQVPIANPVFAAAEVQLRQHFSESWYGMTWAHQLSPRIGVGISPFVVARSQNTRAALLAEGQDASGNVAVRSLSREFDYLHFGVLARLGLSGVRDSLTWGVTVTTPNLSVTGSGNTQYNTTLTDQTGTIGNLIGASYEQGLDAEYRTPFGAGAGASYGWGQTRIHAAVDWNAEVARYAVMDIPAFTISTPGGDSTVHIVIYEHLDEVLNWGLGLEHRFGTTWGGYASYHTDFSGRNPGEAPGGSMTHWDLNHVTIGTTMRVGRSDFAFGVSGAFGKEPVTALAAQPEGGSPPSDLVTKVTMVTVVLGWKIAF